MSIIIILLYPKEKKEYNFDPDINLVYFYVESI